MPSTKFFESKLYELDILTNDGIPKFKANDMSFLNQLPSLSKISNLEQKNLLRTFYRDDSSAYFFKNKIKTILSEIGKEPEQSIVTESCVLVTPSGYGKTRQAFLLACSGFSIYCNLTIIANPLMEPFESDYCMNACWQEIYGEMGRSQEQMKNKSVKSLNLDEAKQIHNIFLKQILLKLIVLYFWIEKYGDEFKPFHYLLSQINGRSDGYGILLRYFFEETKEQTLSWTHNMIRKLLDALSLKINIITDEASVFTYQFQDQFISPTGKTRSILSAYCYAMIMIRPYIDTFLMCGTSMRLIDAEEAISGALKSIVVSYVALPSTGKDKQTIINFWNRFIKVDDLDLANNLESRYWEIIFFSRWRLLSYVIENISFKDIEIVEIYCQNENFEKIESDAEQVKLAKLRVVRFAILSAFVRLRKYLTEKLKTAIQNQLIQQKAVEKLHEN